MPLQEGCSTEVKIISIFSLTVVGVTIFALIVNFNDQVRYACAPLPTAFLSRQARDKRTEASNDSWCFVSFRLVSFRFVSFRAEHLPLALQG